MILLSNFVLLLLRSHFGICFRLLCFIKVLQEALQKILLPSSPRPTYVNVLIDHIQEDSPNITFYPHEILPPKVQNQEDPLMIIVYVNNINIRKTLIDTSSTLKCL